MTQLRAAFAAGTAPRRLLPSLLLVASLCLYLALGTVSAAHVHVRVAAPKSSEATEGTVKAYDFRTGYGDRDNEHYSKQQKRYPLLPVFFFHGLAANATSGDNLRDNLTADGRIFHALTFCPDACSTGSLNIQVQLAITQIRAIVSGPNAKAYANGYIFVGHSQGGVIARGVIEEMDDHKVYALVSLAGAQNGIFYGPQPSDAAPTLAFTKRIGPNTFSPALFDFAKYTPADFTSGKFQIDFDTFVLFEHAELQHQLAVLGLARSPLANVWAKSNPFLPYINNIVPCDEYDDKYNDKYDDKYDGKGGKYDKEDKYDDKYDSKEDKYDDEDDDKYDDEDDDHNVFIIRPTKQVCLADQVRRRTNFLKLKLAHFFGSPADGIIAPWQSSIFGKYEDVESAKQLRDHFRDLRVLDYTRTVEYEKDTYGLRTLRTRDALFLHTVPAVAHECWVADWTPLDTAVPPCRFKRVYDQYVYPVFQQADAIAASAHAYS